MHDTIIHYELSEPAESALNAHAIIPTNYGASAFAIIGRSVAATVPPQGAGGEGEIEVWLIAAGGNASNAIPATEKYLGTATFPSGRQFHVFV